VRGHPTPFPAAGCYPGHTRCTPGLALIATLAIVVRDLDVRWVLRIGILNKITISRCHTYIGIQTPFNGERYRSATARYEHCLGANPHQIGNSVFASGRHGVDVALLPRPRAGRTRVSGPAFSDPLGKKCAFESRW
jgi:hypothetical protein